MLANLFGHRRDQAIVFEPIDHRYFVCGARYPQSVSGMIGEYFSEFDGAATVAKYYDAWRDNSTSKYYQLIMYLTHVNQFSDARCKLEIERGWTAVGEFASRRGTAIHLDIENYLNGAAAADNVFFDQFLHWRATHPTWRPFRTEWSVWGEAELICGQIDSVWVEEEDLITARRMMERGEWGCRQTGPTGRRISMYIVDWKCCAQLKTKGFQGACGRAPLTKLPDTNLGHYYLQQNAYRNMLEKYYNCTVEGMFLVQLHSGLRDFQEWTVPFLESETEAIMENRRSRVLAGELDTEPSCKGRFDDW